MAQLAYPPWRIKSLTLDNPSKLMVLINFEGLTNITDFIPQGGYTI